MRTKNNNDNDILNIVKIINIYKLRSISHYNWGSCDHSFHSLIHFFSVVIVKVKIL